MVKICNIRLKAYTDSTENQESVFNFSGLCKNHALHVSKLCIGNSHDAAESKIRKYERNHARNAM